MPTGVVGHQNEDLQCRLWSSAIGTLKPGPAPLHMCVDEELSGAILPSVWMGRIGLGG
jgi:hypothetical protein